jgi:hypothetical protein
MKNIWTWILFLTAGVALLAPANTALAAKGISDNAGFFSAAAEQKATGIINDLATKHHGEEVYVETQQAVPDGKQYAQYADERTRSSNVGGVYILIIRKGGHVHVAAAQETARLFTNNVRTQLAKQIEDDLRKGQNNFKRADNCFTWLGNPKQAQRLMDDQRSTDWPRALNAVARSLNPEHQTMFRCSPMNYYWTAYQTELATDVLFRDPKSLSEVYPPLVRYAMDAFKSPDVMRFLAQKAPGNFTGEIVTSFKDRAEGVRVKHWLRGNSIKMYDKAGSVLRVETTIGDPTDFKVFRPLQNDPKGKLQWLPLRKGVADLYRRTEVSQRSNDTYFNALAATSDTTPCSKIFDAVSQPVIGHGRRVRALHLADPNDLALLEAIACGEFAISGFRNRDIRGRLYPSAVPDSAIEQRRLAAKVSRQLRILRAHGLVQKIQKTTRYRLTQQGQTLIAAIFATRNADITQLLSKAA